LLYYIEELTRMACENYMNDEAQDKESHRRYSAVKIINAALVR
jgi:hypothetical protein